VWETAYLSLKPGSTLARKPSKNLTDQELEIDVATQLGHDADAPRSFGE